MALNRPTIAGLTFLDLRGSLDAPGNQYEPNTRNNVDGVGLQEIAKRAVPTEMASIVDVPVGQWGTYLAAWKSLQGKAVAIVTNDQSQSNVTVMEVIMRSVKRMAKCVGGVNVSDGSSADIVTAVWRLWYTKPT